MEIKRWLAGLVGLYGVANGLFILSDGYRWYMTAPGASDTGPFNPHFVADIGVGFLIAGLGLCARFWRVRYWPAGLAGAGFLFGHAMIHVVGLVGGHSHYVMVELFGIILPAMLSVWAAFPAKGEE